MKGNNCRFTHPQERAHKTSSKTTRECRNGSNCEYLQRGIRRFNHRERGNQSNRYSQCYNGRGWCKFLEDCFRVPNCPFKHYDEDFPDLPTVKNPPIGMSYWSRGEY